MENSTRKTIEESARLYENKLQDAYNEIDLSHMRKMQKNMYLCAANCCDSTGSFQDVQYCVDNCSLPLNAAQQYLKNEFQEFQNRVQRCLMVCNDKTKEKMELEKSTAFTDKYKLDYEGCAYSCLNKFAENLPSVIFKIKNNLDKNTTQL